MCIQTGKLCNSCQAKMDDGKISKIDVQIGKILMNVGKSRRFLHEIEILKVIETDASIYIISKIFNFGFYTSG